MKLGIGLDDLRDAVTWAARALPHRPVMPVLSGMLLTADEAGTLTMSAFDLDTAATATASARIDEPGSALLPGRLLRDLAMALRGEVAEIVASGDELTLRCDGADVTLRIMPAGHYPALPALPEPAGTVYASDLAAAVASVAPAASDDHGLPLLCAVHLVTGPEGLRLEATNRYQAADIVVPWQPVMDATELNALVPARLLTAIARDLGDGPVSIASDQHAPHQDNSDGEPSAGRPAGLTGLATQGKSLVTRCVTGQFPAAVRQLFPAAVTTTVTTGTAELATAVRTAALLLDDGGRNLAITLDASGDELVVSAPGGERGCGHLTVAAVVDGPSASIRLQSGRLLAAIGPVGDRCRIGVREGTRQPALITPGSDESAYRHLVMPVSR